MPIKSLLRLYRVKKDTAGRDEVLGMVSRIFDSTKKAELWIASTNVGLHGKTPGEVIDEGHSYQVKSLLRRCIRNRSVL
jgi:uncharacterized protein (DUF2384 family)